MTKAFAFDIRLGVWTVNRERETEPLKSVYNTSVIIVAFNWNNKFEFQNWKPQKTTRFCPVQLSVRSPNSLMQCVCSPFEWKNTHAIRSTLCTFAIVVSSPLAPAPTGSVYNSRSEYICTRGEQKNCDCSVQTINDQHQNDVIRMRAAMVVRVWARRRRKVHNMRNCMGNSHSLLWVLSCLFSFGLSFSWLYERTRDEKIFVDYAYSSGESVVKKWNCFASLNRLKRQTVHRLKPWTASRQLFLLLLSNSSI